MEDEVEQCFLSLVGDQSETIEIDMYEHFTLSNQHCWSHMYVTSNGVFVHIYLGTWFRRLISKLKLRLFFNSAERYIRTGSFVLLQVGFSLY